MTAETENTTPQQETAPQENKIVKMASKQENPQMPRKKFFRQRYGSDNYIVLVIG